MFPINNYLIDFKPRVINMKLMDYYKYLKDKNDDNKKTDVTVF